MKKIRKIFISFGILIGLILVLLLTLPVMFKDKIAESVKATANSQLKAELNFTDLEVSFFSHFPRLTIALNDFVMKGSVPFNNDSLISARRVSLGIDVISLFGRTIKINRVYLDHAKVELRYNEKGASNFDVYSSSDTLSVKDTSAQAGAQIKIEQIYFIQCRFLYADPSIPVNLELNGFNYNGKSLIENDILSLSSKIRVDALNLSVNHFPLIVSKPLEAQLSTVININTLDMKLEKNDLKLMGMPLNFTGRFTFLKEGYSLSLRLLSIYEKEVFSAALKLISTDKLYVNARINAVMDLAKWSPILGADRFALRGNFQMNFNADGVYESGPDPSSKMHDTILLSIPKFKLFSSCSGGYFKYKDLPEPITDISFDLNASVKDNNYKNIILQMDKLKAEFKKNQFKGFFHLDGLQDFPVEAKLTAGCKLEELKEVIPLDNIELKGMLTAEMNVKGKYAPEKKLFPVSEIFFSIKDGSLQTKYYPHPLENIHVLAKVSNTSGQWKDTKVSVAPLSFLFEGHPFELHAEVDNPGDIAYNIRSKGTLDMAKIYQLFALEGMDINGYIETDLSLRGLQSDAMAGRYDKLQNKGRLMLKNIGFTSFYLPKKLLLKEGVFRFDNDKVWFEKFHARYGASDIRLDGYLNNVVNYVLAEKQTLRGNFKFTSDYLLVDEFISKAQASSVSSVKKSGTSSSNEGVVMVPDNLEIGLKANLKKIKFEGLEIKDFDAATEIRGGMVLLKGMQFESIGTKVAMDASYGSMTPSSAFFDFHVTALDFDVKRAYREVELFRKIAASAANAEGIVSLDYSLKGKLGAGMKPVYPSLEGGGTLSLKKVKVSGLKLFTVVSKSTEREKLKNPDLSKVDLKTTIRNNVVTLEQVKMRISSFRVKLSGTSNFNGQINLKMRIGLPPLGIIGIPLRVLGTMENPKIKYGRGTSDSDVEETQYTDEMPEELKAKLKNAKEEDLKEDPEEK